MSEQHGPPDAFDELRAVVAGVAYKPGWRVWIENKNRPTQHLAGSTGDTLCISANVPDSGDPSGETYVEHWFAVPPTSWTRPAWERWVLDSIIQVETHEAMEFYSVDGTKRFFPAHGPGRDPYLIERIQ